MKCHNCGNEFNPRDRASPGANAGAIAQIKYCSEKCARNLTDHGRNDPTA